MDRALIVALAASAAVIAVTAVALFGNGFGSESEGDENK